MTLLLQIEQPGRLPLFVSRLHRHGGIAVTFLHTEARRFRAPSPSALRRVRQAVAAWPEPGRAAYLSAPV